MKYIHGTTEFHIEEECVLSLGKFDGLHRGHETLLEHMMEQKNKGCATVERSDLLRASAFRH